MADDSSSDDETLNQGIDNTLASGYQLLPSFENAIDLSSDEDEEHEDTAADGLPKSDGHVRDDESQFEERVLEADDIDAAICTAMPAYSHKIEIEQIEPVKLKAEDFPLNEEHAVEIRRIMAATSLSLPAPEWAAKGDAWLSQKIQELVQKKE